MKKIYIKPGTETVNVHLFSSVLDDSQGNFGPYSHVAGGGDDPGWGDAKEGNLDDFNSEEDIWGGRQMKDAWER
ncbi:MAG: hypothetical protein IKT00_14875 [Prevotella sp.]|nr:hypothetical protein [Prevotella sp.]MBR5657763.1 hypothetical protein [Prevotella sp.]